MLQNTSSRRLKCLELLTDFLQAATAELMWLSEREEVEVARDWLSKDLNLADLDEHHKVGVSWHLPVSFSLACGLVLTFCV